MELQVEEIIVAQEDIPNPLGWRILVEPVRVRMCTEAGIALPDATIKAQEYLRNIGQVIAIGNEGYKHEKFVSQKPWIKAGQWVMFNQYAGQELRVLGQTADGKPGIAIFRALNDDELICEIPNPQAVLIPF